LNCWTIHKHPGRGLLARWTKEGARSYFDIYWEACVKWIGARPEGIGYLSDGDGAIREIGNSCGKARR